MEEPKVDIPKAVDDAELIDRMVYEPSFFCEGRLGPAAFDLTKKDETYISVLRNKYYKFSEITPPKARKEGDTLAGIAQLKVKDVRAIPSPTPINSVMVKVEARGSAKLPSHAEIFTTIDGTPVKGGTQHSTPWFMYVQKELVKLSSYIPFAQLKPEVVTASPNPESC